jgi:hypothetical protein
MDRGALSRTHTKLTIEKRFNAGLLDEARATVVRLRALTPEVMVNHLSPSAIRSIVSSISQARGWRWARRQDRRSHFPIAE